MPPGTTHSYRLDPLGATWSHLESPGAPCSNLELPGAPWSHLQPVTATSWSHSESPGDTWGHLEPPGATWSHLETPAGATWNEPPPVTCCEQHVAPRGYAWRAWPCHCHLQGGADSVDLERDLVRNGNGMACEIVSGFSRRGERGSPGDLGRSGAGRGGAGLGGRGIPRPWSGGATPRHANFHNIYIL